MKTLLLMRHGKSSWKDTTIADHERPLAKRGLRDSSRMGELLGQRELIPQTILSSSAVRAVETAQIINAVCDCNCAVVLSDNLYLAEADTYITELAKLPDDLERVMLIGHNPGLESLLQMLSAQIESLPTAVIAYLTLPIQRWADLTSSTEGELIELWRPKELAEVIKDEHKKEEKVSKKAAKPAKKEEKTAKKTEKPAKETGKTAMKAVKPKKEVETHPLPAEKPPKKEKKKSNKK